MLIAEIIPHLNSKPTVILKILSSETYPMSNITATVVGGSKSYWTGSDLKTMTVVDGSKSYWTGSDLKTMTVVNGSKSYWTGSDLKTNMHNKS